MIRLFTKVMEQRISDSKNEQNKGDNNEPYTKSPESNRAEIK